MSKAGPVLVCRCSERGLVRVDEASCRADHVVVIDDLCKAAKEHDGVLEQHFSEVQACHARAVQALFEFAGFPLGDEVTLVDRRMDYAADLESVDMHPAWYPVLDYSRCTSCGQCHEFCLFGVYEKNADGKVLVAHPGSCKNNCPACARICPETAIIFPKCPESPINGETISDESERKANVKVNVDEILGDDVYAALRARKQKRRSLLNQKKIEKALAERKRCAGGDA